MTSTISTRPLHVLTLVLALLTAIVPATIVRAASVAVTSTAQEAPFITNGNCTLGEAIQAANTDAPVDACPAGAGADTIVLAAGQTYTLTLPHTTGFTGDTGVPPITSAITIVGDGAILERASGADTPPFRLLSITGGDLTVTGLTLRNGRAFEGGAVEVRGGQLTLTDSTVSGNRVDGGSGGALVLSGGQIAITRSLITRSRGARGSHRDGRGGRRQRARWQHHIPARRDGDRRGDAPGGHGQLQRSAASRDVEPHGQLRG
jgi:hypothetical protein